MKKTNKSEYLKTSTNRNVVVREYERKDEIAEEKDKGMKDAQRKTEMEGEM